MFFKGIKDSPLEFEKPIPIKTISGKYPDLSSLKEVLIPEKTLPLFLNPVPSKTKPNLVDLNGDGNLDLIYGEQKGYLIKFNGTADKGVNHFADQAEILKDIDGNFLKLNYSSTPHFIDWDGDNDLDLVCGAGRSGIYYSENIGDAKNPKWKALTEWISPLTDENGNIAQHDTQNANLGIKPGRNLTVYADDYNNDGKLDLIVGDKTILDTPKPGLSNEAYIQKENEYETMQDTTEEEIRAKREFQKLLNIRLAGKSTPETEQKLKEARLLVKTTRDNQRKKETAFKDSFKTSEQVGYVWLYLQK